MFKSITFRWVIQLVIIVSQIIGLLIFLRGFFPSKVVLSGFNGFYESTSPFSTSWNSPKANDSPQFDKVVVMVVDAMRTDFCFSKSYPHMSFLHELINNGHAIPFTSFSNPPTVTLPRLKGITTGGTPSFLDAILNVADDKDTSQGLSSQDSWVSQYKNLGKTINFFGDDTWLKLFPTTFTEFDGTNSFFVSDFTEVDRNVTRHLDKQLSQDAKWDALILHYLGLDHIGHKGGPNSVFMKPKLEEMDGVLKRVYDYSVQQHNDLNESVLIVLMGDHGMNDIGNHGASSPGETSASLSFISPKFSNTFNLGYTAPLDESPDYTYYSKINQIDLVPSLSGLLNFPIPKNNLGVFIPQLLKLWGSESQQRSILYENCQQFMDLFIAKYGTEEESDEYAHLWSKWHSLKESGSSVEYHYDVLYEIQQILTSSATNYDYNDIFLGFVITIVSSIAVLISYNHYFLFRNSDNVPYHLVIFVEAFAVIYSLHFHGSSLIEEEHQIWYFFTIVSAAFLASYYFKSFNKASLLYWTLFLTGIRILKAWNNSGQKYSYKVTIGSYLLNEDTDILWVLIIATYIVYSVSIFVQGGFSSCFDFLNERKGFSFDVKQAGSLISFIAIFVTSSVGLSFKICQFYNDGYVLPRYLRLVFFWIIENYGVSFKTVDNPDFKFQLQGVNTQLSRLSGYCILGLLFIRVSLGKLRKFNTGLITDVSNLITLYLIQQTKFENIPIFLVLLGIKYSAAKIISQTQPKNANIDQILLITSIFIICIQNLTFFSMGNTNSLATVDLSNAYNGILEYDVIPVGVLTFISNFVGPIYWSLASLQIIFEISKVRFEQNNDVQDLINFKFLRKSVLWVKVLITSLFYGISASNLIGSCINLRFHLFIWTVFSPKLLYFASWSILVNFLVDLILASIILFILY
ncbi:major facilitator superfamily [Scheffersomyces coipomensis]|uniref:major facilitator superfamily n=1 Tax=Scheffersomyces coipomensis TaxID=1788519 RepID=UPI00315DC167